MSKAAKSKSEATAPEEIDIDEEKDSFNFPVPPELDDSARIEATDIMDRKQSTEHVCIISGDTFPASEMMKLTCCEQEIAISSFNRIRLNFSGIARQARCPFCRSVIPSITRANAKERIRSWNTPPNTKDVETLLRLAISLPKFYIMEIVGSLHKRYEQEDNLTKLTGESSLIFITIYKNTD